MLSETVLKTNISVGTQWLPNISNITHYLKSEDSMFVPASHCISWFAVLGTVCLATVILNIIIIIIFAKQRRLQRKSAYLIIHLAIVDLLVGAVTGPLWIELFGTLYCDLWEYDLPDSIWLLVLKDATGYSIDKVSLLNLAFIALERTHATFFPFKHRSVKKWVYGVVIIFSWLVPAIMIFTMHGLTIFNHVGPKISLVISSYISILLLLIFACYVSIYVKVRGDRFAQLHGAAGLRERKLTSTMFLVTFGSLLTFLPLVIFWGVVAFDFNLFFSLPIDYAFHIHMAVVTFYVFNSLINPIIYAVRMPQLRAGILQIIFRRTPRHQHRVNTPLQDR